MKKLIIKSTGLFLNMLALFAPKRAGRLGFLLFCRPIRSTLRTHYRAFLDSAEQVTFDYDGLVVKGYRWGRGEKKILFLHGWQSHSYRWKAHIEALLQEGGFTIYAFDAPGHGQTEGSYLSLPYYSELIDHVIAKIAGVHGIVAHSLGGFSTLYSFYRNPALPVERLVLMGTPGEASAFINLYVDTIGLSKRARRVILAYFYGRFREWPEYFSAKRFAQSVNVPGIIIHDKDDPDAPFEHAKEIQGSWRYSKLIVTTGLGHNLRSQEVVAQVTNYLLACETVSSN